MGRNVRIKSFQRNNVSTRGELRTKQRRSEKKRERRRASSSRRNMRWS